MKETAPLSKGADKQNYLVIAAEALTASVGVTVI